MRPSFILFAIGFATASFLSGTSKAAENKDQTDPHKVIVQEVLQTSNYTYLHVKENDSLIWLAVPSMQAKAGETYYYSGAMLMPAFESKELKRTFDRVYFLSGVSVDPSSSAGSSTGSQGVSPHSASPHGETGTQQTEAEASRKSVSEKKEIRIEPAEGCITIAELYSKKGSYSGKTVKVKGQVTKFSPAIMNTNWIHLQDGTGSGGQFDLTVTSKEQLKAGDTVILEGKVALKKDFGYGYFFEVIIEDAVKK